MAAEMAAASSPVNDWLGVILMSAIFWSGPLEMILYTYNKAGSPNLKKIESINSAVKTMISPENKIEQRKAKALMKKIDDLF